MTSARRRAWPLLQPVEIVPEPSAPRVAAPSQRRQILIVDDNEDARLLLVDVLAAFGHQTKDAGFDVHLVKPIDVQRLLGHIVAM